MLTHPTLDQLRALKLDGMAQAFVELETQEEVRESRARRMVGAACSTARLPIATPGASRPDCVPPGCVTAKPRSRMSTSARHAGSTKRCSSNWPLAAGSPSTATC